MSRMWMIRPDVMCRQHLLGEHKELHQIVGAINAGHLAVLNGHAKHQQIDTRRIRERHAELADEMLSRGYNHNSPLPEFVDPEIGQGFNIIENACDLATRCPDCREKIKVVLDSLIKRFCDETI